MKYLFKDANLIDFNIGNFIRGDLLIIDENNRRSVVIDSDIPNTKCADRTIIEHMNGNYLIPAFCDIRCSIGDIFSNRQRTISELISADRGGYRYICIMPVLHSRSNNSRTYSDYLYNISQSSKIVPILASPITLRGVTGSLVNFDELIDLGCNVFCEQPNTPSGIILKAAKSIAEKDALLIVQPCDHSLLFGGVVGKSVHGFSELERIPDLAESIAIERAILISKETSCRIHIPCVSLASSVRSIARAKKEGVNISCSTAPQYFAYDSRDFFLKRAKAKLLPPLRSEKDKYVLLEGIADGTIDCISSDNIAVPLRNMNDDMVCSEFGNSGFLTAFPAAYSYLVKRNVVSAARVVEMMSRRPLEILMNREYDQTQLYSALGVVCPDILSRELFIGTTVGQPYWTSVFDGACLYGRIKKNYNSY